MWRSDVHFGVATMTVTVCSSHPMRMPSAVRRSRSPLAPQSTVADLVTRLRDGHPAELPPRPLVAVNREYATYDQVIEPGDEVALIPPVAGG